MSQCMRVCPQGTNRAMSSGLSEFSTIDLSFTDASNIPIEERSDDEVACFHGTRIAPIDCPVYNPAFDVTPFKYLTGIITEEGICYPPFKESLAACKQKANARRSA